MGNKVCIKCGVPLSYYKETGVTKSCCFHEVGGKYTNKGKCERCDNKGGCYHKFEWRFARCSIKQLKIKRKSEGGKEEKLYMILSCKFIKKVKFKIILKIKYQLLK